MTNDEILQAAKEAGIEFKPLPSDLYCEAWLEELERFAAIIEKRTIERMRWYVQEYCTEHWGKEVLAIPTDSTKILDEVRKHERERVAEFILRTDIGKIPKEWQWFAADGLLKYAEAIRAME